MAKKRSKRNPLDPLRPIKPMRDRKKMQVSTKYRMIGVTLLCLALITVTFVLGQNIKPINAVFGYVAAPFQKAYLAVEDWFSAAEICDATALARTPLAPPSSYLGGV